MSEEIKEETSVVASEVVSSKMETTESKKSGYMSKEEWMAAGKPEADYVSEEEYNRRGPIFDHMKALKKELQELKEFNKGLLQQTTNIEYEIQSQRKRAELEGYQKALADIQAQHRSAVELGDTNLAQQYAVQMSKMVAQQPSTIAPQLPPYIVDFKVNKLHIDDRNVTPETAAIWQYCVAEAMEMDKKNPNRPHLDMLAELELKAKDTFPNYFKKYEVEAKKPVEMASAKQSTKPSVSESESGALHPLQKAAFERTAQTYKQRTGKTYTLKQFLDAQL